MLWLISGDSGAIGRMFTVHPKQGELFALRLLLNVVSGARSFVELRTYDGIEYPTFRLAALKRGVMDDDKEWQWCLEQVCTKSSLGYIIHFNN